MPVPALPAHVPNVRRYGLAVLDRYGRVADRAVLRALAWAPGQPLALTPISRSVHVVPDPEASVRIGTDGYLRLPIGLRRVCRLTPGDQILLVADPAAGRLLLHPSAALTALLDSHHAVLRSAAQGTTP